MTEKLKSGSLSKECAVSDAHGTVSKGIFLLPVIACFVCVIAVSVFWLHEYRRIAFEHISKFSEMIIEENAEAETQVLSALKKYHTLTEQEIDGNIFLSQYGYGNHEFCKGLDWNILTVSSALFFVTAGCFLAAAGYEKRRSRMRIAELTNYLEQVNAGGDGTIMQKAEDEFSHLQDELYKTVTELYQTRETAVKAKINFADNLANIAHQLKTPITAALLSLQLMQEAAPNVYGSQVKRQLKRLESLEESLLTLSKIDAGTLGLEHSAVDVYTVLNLAAENLEDLLAKEGVTVSIPDKGCAEITGDLEWTMEAVMNLMKNCMEHSPHGGTVHCDYSRNPLYVEIRIWDEGKGFRPEDIPHLFERFYRGKRSGGGEAGTRSDTEMGNDTERRNDTGIGIGLSLARSIFELQNGNITARNLPQGGACFEIRVYSH